MSAAGQDLVIKVTVAIPTYNRANLLRQTLTGICAQQFPREHFEILVIDNNSPDHTGAVVAEFANQHPAPRRVCESKQGLDHARNRAIAEARGEIILFGDDDILVPPDWLAQMTVPLLADPARRIGAVGGEVIPFFPDGMPAWVANWHSSMRFRTDTGPLSEKDTPMGANLAFPKWVFSQVGLFNAGLDRVAGSYFSGGDSELLRRVRMANLEVWFAPGAAVKHQITASRTTFRYAARQGFDSARSRVVDRANQPGAVGYLASRFVANVGKAFGFGLLALLNGVIFRTDDAKKALVRSWRSCGYLYQIPRSIGRRA